MLLAFKLYRLVLSEIKAERHPWFLILDPRQLATESYEWGLKPRNMRTTKQTNKQTSFISLFAVKTELLSDKIKQKWYYNI